MSNLYIPFCSFILGLFLIILFLAKVKENFHRENVYYFIMIIDTFLSSIFCIVAIYLIYCGQSENIIVKLMNKLECFTITNFAVSLLMYVYTFVVTKNNLTQVRNSYFVLNILIMLCIIIMPISLDINEEIKLYGSNRCSSNLH